MRDFRKIELVEGDEVLYFRTGRYARIFHATIVGFTPQKVRIQIRGQEKYGTNLVEPHSLVATRALPAS